MDAATITTLITALLGGGAVATITALFNGIKKLKDGRREREKATVDDLSHWMEKWEQEYRVAERDLVYYRDLVGRYLFQMRIAGVTPEPETPNPPSERGEAG